jgi:hypothetical protein
VDRPLFIDRRPLNDVQTVCIVEIAGAKFAGDSQGIYINSLFGIKNPPIMISAVLHTNPDSCKFIGGISQPQEVISLRGSCKPRDTETLLI